jgi:hypothetical protein
LEVQPVQIATYRPGVEPLLYTAVVDNKTGANISEVMQPANQYTVSLDIPGNGTQSITVLQGPLNPIPSGEPVMINTGKSVNDRMEVKIMPRPGAEVTQPVSSQ